MVKREGVKVSAPANVLLVDLEGLLLGEAVCTKLTCWISRLGHSHGSELLPISSCGEFSNARFVFTLRQEAAAFFRLQELVDGLRAKIGS